MPREHRSYAHYRGCGAPELMLLCDQGATSARVPTERERLKMGRTMRRVAGSAGFLVLAATTLVLAPGAFAAGATPVTRAALVPGSINNVLVIELENEDASTTFGPNSPATY